MTEQENYISVFKEIKTAEGRVREPIGDFPVESSTYDLSNGRRISLDLSRVNPRFRGPKIIGVRFDDDLRVNEISLRRLTGRGYQTLPTNIRLGVEVYNPRGVTRT